ncbi:heavy-metal-associated domain-containing protein [Flavobacterium weaverense]|uniref:Copper chaperone CopZ n=1 Tax=Flavobacterium weaverense TaxID=271156 RepID=A0A3L9ZZN4_9FLAO|nr:heavy metal-associated domain-containing protein [Flavobacterium weaverense]RMA77960.1 copper chaperone CopZ [Flavobacterium weaverense]
MNFKNSILTLAVASILFVGCKEKSNETDLKETAVNTEVVAPKVKKEIAAVNLQTTSFSIDGMTCAIGCAKTIQEDLTALDGVQDAKVDFDTKLATVTFDKTVLNQEKLTKVVESAADGKSYTVSNVKS